VCFHHPKRIIRVLIEKMAIPVLWSHGMQHTPFWNNNCKKVLIYNSVSRTFFRHMLGASLRFPSLADLRLPDLQNAA
jgi:hypothetical protein